MRLVKGPCRSQNYFGTQRVGNGFSIPSSRPNEYKMLWSEECGAMIGHVMFLLPVNVLHLCRLYLGKWKKLNHIERNNR